MLPHVGGGAEVETFFLRDRILLRRGKGLDSQGIATVPLKQGLQSTHRKCFSPKICWNWFSLQPHTVSLSALQGEISTWDISEEGRK